MWISTWPVEEAAERLAFIAEAEGKPRGRGARIRRIPLLPPMPGGMVSNLAYQLEGMGLQGRLNEILEEAGMCARIWAIRSSSALCPICRDPSDPERHGPGSGPRAL